MYSGAWYDIEEAAPLNQFFSPQGASVMILA